MSRQLIKVFSLACALAVASCTDAGQITRALEAPVGESHTVHAPNGKEFTIVAGQLPATVRSVSAEIGPDGGVLVLAGPAGTAHTLTVPAGAVNERLRFEMTLSDGNDIMVDLAAYRLKGRPEEVGHLGFKKPVLLSLSYAFAAPGLDPSRLSIVYLVGRAVKEQLPTRAGNGRFVVGELRHFSRYAVAEE
jgi:hypothetical protein